MINSSLTEEWIPVPSPFVNGECSVSSIEYNATDLSVTLDSFVENRTIKIIFTEIFAYRVTLEHFRWADLRDTPPVSATLVRVKNSNYIKWLEDAGLKQLYGSALDVHHYLLQTTEHIIDVALLAESAIYIDGNLLVG